MKCAWCGANVDGLYDYGSCDVCYEAIMFQKSMALAHVMTHHRDTFARIVAARKNEILMCGHCKNYNCNFDEINCDNIKTCPMKFATPPFEEEMRLWKELL